MPAALSRSPHRLHPSRHKWGQKKGPYLLGAGACFSIQGNFAYALLPHAPSEKNRLRKTLATIWSPRGKLSGAINTIIQTTKQCLSGIPCGQTTYLAYLLYVFIF